jgi:lipoprotein-anchoring transpeptidase ErfK/SrfK
MCSLASPRHLRGLVIVSLLAMMLVFPARGQAISDSGTRSTSAANARAQSELKREPASANPASPKASSNTVTSRIKTEATAAAAETKPASTVSSPGAKQAGSAVLINIDKTNQKMTVFLDGVEKYDWPVSTGRAGYSTPSGTYTATSMNEIWYSKQWDNSPMPHSIFFMKDGHAIHGSYEVKNLGKPASHGCVRISPENAAALYALVKENGLENTQVVLNGVTPGGEYKVASPADLESRYGEAGWYGPGDGYYTQFQTRPSSFGFTFDGRYYNEPQGYVGSPRPYSRGW